MTDWTQVAMFWATVGLVAVTFFATILNYWLVRSQHDPHIVVYPANDPDRPSVIVLIIENVGRGIAYNVRFESSRPIPWKAWGLSSDSAQDPQLMENGPLVDGIPLLAPGQKRVMNWGQYWGLKAALGDKAIRVKATYESRGVLPWNPTEHLTESVLEAESFSGTVAHHRPLVEVKNDLQKIRRSIEHLASGFKELRVAVEIRDSAD